MHKLKIISIALLTLLVVLFAIFLSQPDKQDVLEHPISEKAKEPVPDFSKYTDVTQKKKAFFDYLRPEVEAQNEFILSQREFVHAMRAKYIAGETITESQQQKLNKLIEDYRVEESEDLNEVYEVLLRRVDIIPVELVLVQTANESAWGTSRFARQGYNFFGLWCFKKGCGFVPKRRNKGAVHEVAKFEDLSSAMHSYMLNLNRHNAYSDLRRIRQAQRDNMKTVTALALTEGLQKYSERGDEYIKELQQMIRVNKDLMSDEV